MGSSGVERERGMEVKVGKKGRRDWGFYEGGEGNGVIKLNIMGPSTTFLGNLLVLKEFHQSGSFCR